MKDMTFEDKDNIIDELNEEIRDLEEQLTEIVSETEQEISDSYHQMFVDLKHQCEIKLAEDKVSDREKDFIIGKIQLLTMFIKTRDASYTDAELIETNMVFTLGGLEQ